jgi:uncharacterized membrane protein YkoI
MRYYDNVVDADHRVLLADIDRIELHQRVRADLHSPELRLASAQKITERNKRMNLAKKLILALFVVGLATLSVTYSQEKKIGRKDLPPAVEKTVAEQSKGASIKGFSTEVENGKKLYEVGLTVNGHGKDISIDAQGKVVETEEEVSLGSLPTAVKDGLAKAAGKGIITEVESLSKGGKLVAYEAAV